ncbi:MAG: hypothetical protein IPG50_31100 [Myxococcales bacterium]|nr:hypothetical protein [Myxococcales bacterium]
MVSIVGVSAVALALLLVALVSLAIGAAARRAGGRATEASRSALWAGGGMALWLAVTAAVASTGFFTAWDARPPRLVFAPLTALFLVVVASRTEAFRRALRGAPLTWPVLLHTMRVPIELGLWALCVAGELPKQMTFEGRNFDVLVGLTAPLVALLVARGTWGARALLAWNLASLALLVNIVAIAITSIPGPLHLDWPGVPNTIVARWPFVWLPAFFVPLAVFGHVISLRQLAALRRARVGAR